MVCESCTNKWYVCTFCKVAPDLLPGADDACCRDILYCQLCRSWLETWWQIYPNKQRDPEVVEEE